MKTVKKINRVEEIKSLINEAVDLEQCKVLREDISAADISEDDKFMLNNYLALTAAIIKCRDVE